MEHPVLFTMENSPIHKNVAFPNLFDPTQNFTQILQLGLSTSCFDTLQQLCANIKGSKERKEHIKWTWGLTMTFLI